MDLQVLAERLLSCSPGTLFKADWTWRVKAGHQGWFWWRSKKDGPVCMWQQATWSLRLLLLGGSWDKSHNTGEILCCWAGLNLTSLSTQNSGQTMGMSFFGPDLILQLACQASSMHWCVLLWFPRRTWQVAAATNCTHFISSKQLDPTNPAYWAGGHWEQTFPCCDTYPAAQA